MRIRNVFFLVLFTFFSCDSKLVYNEFNSNFENNRWVLNDAKTFTFNIEQEEVYDVVLHLGHIYDFHIPSIPLQTAITFPDGHTETQSIDLKIKDSNGKDIADCSGDICDLYYILNEKVTLPKGNYIIVITNKKDTPYLPNILGIGVQVKK